MVQAVSSGREPDSAYEKDLRRRVMDESKGQKGAEPEVVEERAVELSNDDKDATP